MITKIKNTINQTFSLATIVILAMVIVTISLMIIFGGAYYYREVDHTRGQIKNNMEMISGQISSSLIQPMWTLNHQSIAKIIESFMQDKNVYGVIVRDHDRRVIAMTRDNHWNIISTDNEIPPANDLLYKKTNLVFNQEIIGTVEIFVSLRFIEEDLRRSLLMRTSIFVSVNIIFVSVLILVLMVPVIKPLKAIEDYAVKVNSAKGSDNIYIPNRIYGTEMMNLKISIEEMVKQIHDRYGELQLSQIAVRDAEAKYRGIFNNAAEGIFQITPNGHMITANMSLARILGYDYPEELLRKYENASPEVYADPKKIDEIITLMNKQGYIKDFEYHTRRKDGSPVILSIDAHTIRDQQGHMMHYEGMAKDVTVKKRLDEMRIAKEAAEKATQSKNEFLANISHEIRTPMNAIIGFTNLAMKGSITPKLKNYLNTIDGSAKTLLQLINTVLDFSKIEADRLEMESVDFYLDEVIKNMTNMVSFKATEKEVQFIILIDNDVPNNLVGDPLRLGQVLVNLTNNAAKFTSSGYVMVKVESLYHDSLNCRLKFSVKDTGIGITAEHLSKLFQPFSQADSSVTRRFGGTGLGLAISKHLVEMMGGNIEVTSDLGQGSTFYFTITFCISQNKSEITSADASSEETKNKDESGLPDYSIIRGARILLVEDNIINQQLSTELLQEHGLNVEIASSGQEALGKLNSANYDIVLMDIQMPAMSGFETTAFIRKNPNLKNLPVIAMTANSMSQIKEEFLAAEMSDYVSKPLDSEILLSTMVKWIQPQWANETAKSAYSPGRPEKENMNIDLPASLPGIDIDSALKRLEGNKILFIKLLKTFRRNYEFANNNITEALNKDDFEASAKIAHTIKGVAGNLSAESLCKAAGELEEHIKNGRNHNSVFILKRFEEELLVVCQSIKSIDNLIDTETGQNTVKKTVDISLLYPLISELDSLLHNNNLHAAKVFAELRSSINCHDYNQELKNLEDSIDSLDFFTASKSLNILSEKLTIPLRGE